MENLINYYNSLLGIEIAVFGIISAVILVFIQLVYSTYSYNHISHILRNRYLYLYFGFSVFALMFTSAGSYFLSIGEHDIIPTYNFGTNLIISNQYYVLGCLLLIFFSVFFFVLYIHKNITYLQPHRAIFLLTDTINYKNIRDFIWKKYELNSPFSKRIKIIFEGEEYDPGTDQFVKVDKEKEDAENRNLENIEKQIDAIKKSTKNKEDVLLPLRDMMIQFIKRTDLSSLNEAGNLLLKVSRDFINKIPKKDSNSNWEPEIDLISNFTSHVIDIFMTLLEIAEKEGTNAAKKSILEVSREYSKILLECKNYNELHQLFDFWQKIADLSIGTAPSVFCEIIGYYKVNGDFIFNILRENPTIKLSGDINQALNKIFQNIGWLGERLLINLPLEESPLTRNYHYRTEYHELYNCLLSFSDTYENEQPNAYPHIYFISLYGVLKRLVEIQKSKNTLELDDNIYNIVYTYIAFAHKAISIDNGAGAEIAIIYIIDAYEYLKSEGLDKIASDVIKSMVKIGILAASHKEMLKTSDGFQEPLDKMIMDKLVQARVNFNDEIFDCYIHNVGSNREAFREFITTLGKRLKTDFGLGFDTSIGEPLQDDEQS